MIIALDEVYTTACAIIVEVQVYVLLSMCQNDIIMDKLTYWYSYYTKGIQREVSL